MIKEVNENRLLKVIISIILCFTVTVFSIYMKCVEVYAAFPLVLPLFGLGLLFVIAILVMAGLTFESVDQATIAANQWYIDLQYGFPGISEIERTTALTDFMQLYGESAIVRTVTDSIWNFTKKWVNYYYDTGQNNINRDVYAVEETSGEFIEYSLTIEDRILLGDRIEWDGKLYHWEYDSMTTSGYYIYNLKRGARSYNKSALCDVAIEPRFFVYATDENKLALGFDYVRDGVHTYGGLSGYSDIPYISGYEAQIQLARGLRDELEYNIAAVGAVDVVDNPEWDYETTDGRRAVYVPAEGTVDNYINVTHEELLEMTNQAITDVPGVDEEEKAWWQDVIGGVKSKVDEAGQLIAGTLEDIKAWMEGTYQNIIGSIAEGTASIAEEIRAQQEEDLEPKAREFKLLDIFVIFLDVLIACIKLVIRACVYLATIVTIPPDGSLLNDDTQSGLNFFKNQIIPVINISIWDMYSGLMTLVISLAVVKRVRRIAE